ncbi:MAG: AAA family ATPase, partial [Thermoplasmata archaeon]|nr:AAA family ATPase [Thermoplasmata archaeon]
MTFRSPHPHLTPIFIGRKEEITAGLSFFEQHREKGGMLLVEGTRGVGKSRFIDELVTLIGEGGRKLEVWRTSGKGVDKHPLHSFRAILPWREMVNEARKNFPTTMIPAYESRYLIFNALSNRIKEMVEEHLTLLVIEDLHLCDEMSLYLLHYILRNNVPLVVIASLSPEETVRRDVVNETLGLMNRERLYELLSLPLLDRPSLERIISNMLGRRPSEDVLDRIWSLTEGNPFVAVQIVQSLIMEEKLVFKGSTWEFSLPENEISFPESLEAMVHERMDALPEQERKLLQACSVLGHVIPFYPLMRMVEIPENEVIDILESLMDKGDLVPVDEGKSLWGDEEYAFPSVMMSHLAYEGISGSKRMELHIEAAKALGEYVLQNASRREDLMPIMARHYSLGGDFGRALPLFIGAGKRAESLSAYKDAKALYADAVDLMEEKTGTPPYVYSRVLLDAARMAIIVGETKKSEKWLGRAVEMATKYGLRKMEIEARIYLGEIELEKENFLEAESTALATLQDAVLMGDIEHIGWCFERLGQVYWRVGKLKQAKDFLENGLSYATASGDRLMIEKITTDLANVSAEKGDTKKALRLYRMALAILKEKPNKYEESRVYNNMGFVYMEED